MMLHNALFIGWAYPIVVHWCRFGWLYENGYTDQAGGGIVLMSAGFAGMFATIMLGSRIDRYSPSHQADFRPSNVPFMVIGSVLIWVALFGFSTGSTYSIVGFDSTRVPLAALNTILASGMGGFTASMMHYVMNRRFSNR
jgi:Amt family ammonium transporter